MELKKGTEVKLLKVMSKSENGKYIAVLSDNSVDRDNEIVGEKALNKACMNDSYVPILMDHENKVLNQIGEWTNKRMEKKNGHSAFLAEPKFYLSNKNAVQIKGMLDEGAKIGISIGAIVNDYDEVEIEDKTYKRYTDIELLEASFVAIPSNRSGMAQAVAKAFNCSKLFMGENMTEKKEEKTPDFEERVKSLEESNKNKDAEIEKLKAELEEVKACSKPKKEMEEEEKKKSFELKESMDKKFAEINKKLEETEKKVKELEEKPVFKARAEDIKVEKSEELEKSGLPIMYK